MEILRRPLIWHGHKNENYLVDINGQIYSLKNKVYLNSYNSKKSQQHVRLYINGYKETLMIHQVVSETFPDLMYHTPLCRFIQSGGQLTQKAQEGINLSISVDHKDRNPHNNLISNLRFSTRTEQNLNSNPNRTGTCVYKGVSEHQQRENKIGLALLCVFAKKQLPIVGCSGRVTKYRRVYSKDDYQKTEREFAILYDESLRLGIQDHFSDHPILAHQIINEVAYFNSDIESSLLKSLH